MKETISVVCGASTSGRAFITSSVGALVKCRNPQLVKKQFAKLNRLIVHIYKTCDLQGTPDLIVILRKAIYISEMMKEVLNNRLRLAQN